MILLPFNRLRVTTRALGPMRLFTTAPEKSADIFDALEEEVEQDVGFDEWLKSTKAALSTSKGRHWLGKTSPFPYNSAFVPKAPLSNASKTRIYELFKADPKANDHRALSAQFKISLERVKAIIRQKELELELCRKGFTADPTYIEQMESNLEPVNVSDELRSVEQPKSLPVRPIFVSVPEGRSFDFEDAKAVLLAQGIRPKFAEENAKDTQEKHSAVERKVVEISKSEFERARSKFVFVDTSKKDTVHILVRDTDGTLRTPTSAELTSAVKKTWNRNAPKNTLKNE